MLAARTVLSIGSVALLPVIAGAAATLHAGLASAASCTGAAVVLLLSLAAALREDRRAAAAGAGAHAARTRPLGSIVAFAVLLLGGASLLLAGGVALAIKDAAGRARSRQAAAGLASLGARLIDSRVAGDREAIVRQLAATGGAARLVFGDSRTARDEPSSEACEGDRAPLPCAVEPLPDGAQLVVAVAAPPLAPLAGQLLFRAGLVLLALLVLAGALARAANRALDVAIGDFTPGAGVGRPVRLPQPLGRAISERLRAATSPPIEPAEEAPDDLIDAVAAELSAHVRGIEHHVAEAERHGGLNAAQAEDLALIRAGTGELQDLVGSVRDLSAPDAPLRLARAPTDIAAVAAEVVRSLRPAQQQRALTVIVDDRATPPIAAVDPRWIRQLLANLLSSALRHGDRGPIALRIGRDRDTLVLEVKQVKEVKQEKEETAGGDTEQPHPAPRLRGGTGPLTVEGAGAALALGQRIVEAHGGTLAVDSDSGERSSIVVRLPLAFGGGEAPEGAR